MREDVMDEACRMHGRDEECIHNFSQKTLGGSSHACEVIEIVKT
jgi:hypothetical protein